MEAHSAEEAGVAAPKPASGPSNFIGKHRLEASISYLDQQIKSIRDELQELETVGGPSSVCTELISGVELARDPLLPMTSGPADAGWERVRFGLVEAAWVRIAPATAMTLKCTACAAEAALMQMIHVVMDVTYTYLVRVMGKAPPYP
ncbi:hypothetical protein Nepgr_009830 [Nepenthes gracilis]|uniref:Uncharacterized protein n=1 Tax=Nepenthes gracilis TaxID=150966 RepID=A0AAD3SC15_NEPGR|nr:hypothetical protein Nepgr_009830 [Nepenthes gracilis]